MAAPNITALEVGSYFINQYYQILSETPDLSHRFYHDSSTMTRVDGDDIQTVSTMLEIHSLLTSLNVSKVEVTQLNAQNSWNGGILLIVSGIVGSRNFYGKRKFNQAFFLAPQDSGFFVMNDVLQFQDEDLGNQHPVPELHDIPVGSEVHAPNPYPEHNAYLEQTAPNYELEEETREYVNSLHIEDDNPIDKYSLPDEQQHEEIQPEMVVREAPAEELYSLETIVNHVEDHPSAAAPVLEQAPAPAAEPATEPVGERAKLSYASILQAAKGQSSQSFAPRQPTVRQSMPPPPQVEQRIQTTPQQFNPSASVPDAYGAGTDNGFAQDEVELTSVYVRGLPPNVTNADLEKAFKSFGKIKPGGVFIRNKKDIGICFAFVEYEDMTSVHNAIQASPIELLEKQVYIEGRRASTNTSTRGGAVARGRGRGRGRDSVRNPGRGSTPDGNSYSNVRGNGFQQRAYQ